MVSYDICVHSFLYYSYTYIFSFVVATDIYLSFFFSSLRCMAYVFCLFSDLRSMVFSLLHHVRINHRNHIRSLTLQQILIFDTMIDCYSPIKYDSDLFNTYNYRANKNFFVVIELGCKSGGNCL